jgi:hypothetical protein
LRAPNNPSTNDQPRFLEREAKSALQFWATGAASGELLVENTETRVACRAYAILQKGRIFEFSKGSW